MTDNEYIDKLGKREERIRALDTTALIEEFKDKHSGNVALIRQELQDRYKSGRDRDAIALAFSNSIVSDQQWVKNQEKKRKTIMSKAKAAILDICRLRIGTDGHGVRTLVAFHGCPLRCKYCLNPDSLKDSERVKRMLPEEVMEEVRKDELYYIATNGGITFGGGEPLLNSQYIKDILELGANKWSVAVETSLNVPRHHLELLLPYIDEYVVDIKDMNTQIYESYTGKSNSQVKENLKWLVEQGMAERILCRIPLIPNYNNASDQEKSKKELSEMGITRFEMFTYLIDKERESIRNKICKLKEEFRKIATRGIIDEE